MSLLDSIKQLPGIKQVSEFTDFLGQSLYDVSLANSPILKPLLNGTTGLNGLDSLVNRVTQNELTGAQREGAELEVQNQRELRRTQAADEVAGYKDAGINPALMYGQGMQTSTGSASTPSATPLNLSELVQLATVPAELGRIKAETEKVKADTAKTASETDLNTQLREFNEQINPLRVKAQELNNKLTAANERKIYKQVEEIDANISLRIKEAETEEERKSLVISQRLLNEANAKQINDMLPYQIMLAEAQTDAMRAKAALDAINAAYQNRILNSDYLDNMFDEMRSRAGSAEAQRVMAEIRASIRNGTYGRVEPNGNILHDVGAAIQNFGSSTLSGFVNFVDNLNPLANTLK